MIHGNCESNYELTVVKFQSLQKFKDGRKCYANKRFVYTLNFKICKI